LIFVVQRERLPRPWLEPRRFWSSGRVEGVKTWVPFEAHATAPTSVLQ
jgi:hypothetical protein